MTKADRSVSGEGVALVASTASSRRRRGNERVQGVRRVDGGSYTWQPSCLSQSSSCDIESIMVPCNHGESPECGERDACCLRFNHTKKNLTMRLALLPDTPQVARFSVSFLPTFILLFTSSHFLLTHCPHFHLHSSLLTCSLCSNYMRRNTTVITSKIKNRILQISVATPDDHRICFHDTALLPNTSFPFLSFHTQTLTNTHPS